MVMDFRTQTEIISLNPRLRHSAKVLVMGSCFAEHIGERLARMKFRTLVNPYGVLYNPMSIATGLERLIERRPFELEELHEFPDGGWNTWLHHSRYSKLDKEEALQHINTHFAEAADRLAEADVLILTLGTAWVYRLAETRKVVGNCHKVADRQFERERLTAQEIVAELSKILCRAFEINPKLRVLFTVSPVRHLKDGQHGNQLSKATLLLAVDELCRTMPERCYYFPAYEIVVDELRDYRFYADDMAHPSAQAIRYVWECFVEHCIDDEAQWFMEQWEKIARAMEHRPFQPDSEQYKRFMEQTRDKILALKERHPYLEVKEEVDQLTK